MIELHLGSCYAPMRVVARMGEPIAYLGDLLHLDGLLAYGAYHDLDERTRRTIPPIDATDWPVDVAQPLSVWSVPADPALDERLLKSRNGIKRSVRGSEGIPAGTERRLWGWCASAADESAWLARGKVEIRKKPDLTKMRRYTDAKSHNLGSGHMKAYDLAFPTVTALEVVWYAHGDPERVRHLLSKYVPAIGKKRNLGNGTVTEWVVEETSEDRSVLHEGRPTRRLPRGACEGAPGTGAIRPPYYHSSRFVESVEPC